MAWLSIDRGTSQSVLHVDASPNYSYDGMIIRWKGQGIHRSDHTSAAPAPAQTFRQRTRADFSCWKKRVELAR